MQSLMSHFPNTSAQHISREVELWMTTRTGQTEAYSQKQDVDWTILFSRGHLWSQKEDLFFLSYTMSKNNELLSDHHHINIINTQYQLQSLRARGLVQSLVYQRPLGVWSRLNYKTIIKAKMILQLRHLWEARSRSTIKVYSLSLC